jgi:hypothetical protein
MNANYTREKGKLDMNNFSQLNIIEPMWRSASFRPFNVKETGPFQGYVKSAHISGSTLKGHELAKNTHPLRTGSTSIQKMFMQAALLASVVLCTIFASQTAMNMSSRPNPFKSSIKLLRDTSIDVTRYDSACKLLVDEMTDLRIRFSSLERNLDTSRSTIGADIASSIDTKISVIAHDMARINKIKCPHDDIKLETYTDIVHSLNSKITRAWQSLEADISISLAAKRRM